MSEHKYRKHQRSRKPKFLLQDSKGNIIISGNNEKEYMEKRQIYLEHLKMEERKSQYLEKDEGNWDKDI